MQDEFVPSFETGYIKDDGKNLMMTNTPQTMDDRKKQERIWREVINQMQNSISNYKIVIKKEDNDDSSQNC